MKATKRNTKTKKKATKSENEGNKERPNGIKMIKSIIKRDHRKGNKINYNNT